MPRKRKIKTLSVFQRKVLSLLYELQEQGLCCCNSGIKHLLEGNEEYMTFSELKMFGCYASVNRKTVSGTLLALENRDYITSFIDEELEERFFVLSPLGEKEAIAFLTKYDKNLRRPHLKRAKKEFIRIPQK